MRILTRTLIVLALAGCAHTEISSYVDPNYSKAPYRSALVMSSIQNIGYRQHMESSMCETLRASETRCVRAIDLFPPTEGQRSDEVVVDRIISSGVEAVILIQFAGSFTESAYIPQQSTTSATASTYGNTTYLQGSTTTFGGYGVEMPRNKDEVSVIDVDQGKQVMVASALTKGGAGTRVELMLESLAQEISNEMISHGMLPPRADQVGGSETTQDLSTNK